MEEIGTEVVEIAWRRFARRTEHVSVVLTDRIIDTCSEERLTTTDTSEAKAALLSRSADPNGIVDTRCRQRHDRLETRLGKCSDDFRLSVANERQREGDSSACSRADEVRH